MLPHDFRRPEPAQRRVLEVGVACQAREAQPVQNGDAVAGRDRAIVQVLLADEQVGRVFGRHEVASDGVLEAVPHPSVQVERGLEDGDLERGLIELDQAPHHERVVVQHSVDAGLSVAVAVQQIAALVAHRVKDERRGLEGGGRVIGSAKRPTR